MATRRVGHREKSANSRRSAAAECIGEWSPGMSLFVITMGKFGLVDIIDHALDKLGPCEIQVWTWMAADYDVAEICADSRIVGATMLIDLDVRQQAGRARDVLTKWPDRFGPASLKYIVGHCKILAIKSAGLSILVRGSANLCYTSRTEQLDITEGGPDFDLIWQAGQNHPVLPADASHRVIANACGTSQALTNEHGFTKGLTKWKSTSSRNSRKTIRA